MNEQLIVKNFGPIKDATVDFKRVTVFIGPTGGGKSTLAKLAAVFREFTQLGNNEQNQHFLDFYQIKSFVNSASKATWGFDGFQIILKEYELELDKELSAKMSSEIAVAHQKIAKHGSFPSWNELTRGASAPSDKLDESTKSIYRSIMEQLALVATTAILRIAKVHYVPAERVYLPSITRSLAALMRDNFNLPKTLLEFINQYMTARYEVNQLFIDFLKIDYHLQGDEDIIFDKRSDTKLLLSEAASGIQSVTPLLLLLEHLSRNTEQAQSFIIEEPELNLYPTAQQGLLNWLVEKCTQGENDLTITTHSPYILSSCNLLLEAYKVAQLRPDLEDEIAAIVPKACWLNPDEFAAYYVADGTVKPITDERTHLIGGNELDAVSGDISDSFRKLLRLQKQKQPTA